MRWNTTGEQVTVIAMRGKGKITFLEQVKRWHAGHFLAYIDMEVTDIPVSSEIDQFFFEAPDKDRNVELVQNLVAGNIG
jgi:hypothetical protein